MMGVMHVVSIQLVFVCLCVGILYLAGEEDQITYVDWPEHGKIKITRKHRRDVQTALRKSEAIVIMISKCL